MGDRSQTELDLLGHPSRWDAASYAMKRCQETEEPWVAYTRPGFDLWYARPERTAHHDRVQANQVRYDPDNLNQALVEEMEKRLLEGAGKCVAFSPLEIPTMRILFFDYEGKLLCQWCQEKKPPDDCEWLKDDNGHDFPVCRDCLRAHVVMTVRMRVQLDEPGSFEQNVGRAMAVLSHGTVKDCFSDAGMTLHSSELTYAASHPQPGNPGEDDDVAS